MLSSVTHLLTRPKQYLSLTALALLITIGVVGCGGGGGGGNDSSSSNPPPSSSGAGTSSPSVSAPLAINSNNGIDVASTAILDTESVFQYSEVAKSSIEFTAQQQIFPLVVNCDAGTKAYDFVDRDSNHVPSPGDTLNVTYNHCRNNRDGETVSGVFAISLQLPPAASGFNSQLSGTVVFQNFEVSDDFDATTIFKFSGGFSFDIYERPETLIMEISTDTVGLKISAESNSGISFEKIIITSGRKSLHYDTAGYQFEINGAIQSQDLGGQVSISTPLPIVGHLNNYPVAGKILVTGKSNSSISISPVYPYYSGTGVPTASPTIDESGAGSGNTIGSLLWSNFSTGLMWEDPNGPSNATYNAPETFSLLYSSIPSGLMPTISSVNPEIRLQFNRQLKSPQALSAKFYCHSMPNADVDTDIIQLGALLIITPKAPLQHGASYQLRIDQFIYADNNQLVSNDLNPFQTPATLHASATASLKYATSGQSVSLSGINSNSLIGPLSYKWTQLAGTATAISDDTSVNASFIAPNLSASAEALKFQLTITAKNGEFEKAIVPVTIFQSANSLTLFSYTSDPGDIKGEGKTNLILVPPGTLTFDYNMFQSLGDVNLSFSGGGDGALIAFSPATPALLQVGHYANVTSNLQSTTNPHFYVSLGPNYCDLAGDFDISEVSYDVNHRIDKLALDFVVHCTGSTALLKGSLRIRSAVAPTY